MSDLLRDLWYFAATSRELKRGGMFRREILGEPVLLGRDGEGRAFALRDICPHRAVPLSAGRIAPTNGVQTSGSRSAAKGSRSMVIDLENAMMAPRVKPNRFIR